MSDIEYASITIPALEVAIRNKLPFGAFDKATCEATLEVVREFAEKNNHTISAMVSFDRSATEKVVSLTKLLRFISGELER